MALEAILLKVGYQKYSCPAPGAIPDYAGFTGGPLYDVGYLLRTGNPSDLKKSAALRTTDVLDMSLPKDREIGTHEMVLDTEIYQGWAVPKEWFSRRSPTAVQWFLHGRVAQTEDAPRNPKTRGKKGEGAIAWARINNGEGTEAFRVHTVGGEGPKICAKKEELKVKYAAQYWIYQNPNTVNAFTETGPAKISAPAKFCEPPVMSRSGRSNPYAGSLTAS